MVQLRLFAPRTDWRPPDLSALPRWRGARRVCLDVETCDPELKKSGIGVRHDGFVVGIGMAVQREESDGPERWARAYLPIRHEGGGNLDPAAVWHYLRTEAADYRGEIVGAGLPYDVDYLLESDVVLRPSFFRDVQVAEPLLDENQFTYGLDAILERHGLPGKDEDLLRRAAAHYGVDPKGGLWRLPAHLVGPYAEADVDRPLRLIQLQESAIRAVDASDERVRAGRAASLWSLYDLESRLLPVLVDLRRRGIRFDPEHLDRIEARCTREAADAAAELSRRVGRRLEISDLNRAALIGPVLEEATGLRFGRTPSGQVELQKDFLEGLQDETVDLYLRARRFDKLRTSFAASIRSHAVGDRVHPTYNQLRRDREQGGGAGTVSGRLSSTDPNIQQQPIRDSEVGAFWRRLYLPDEDCEWASLDFSSQEPRWLVHMAAESRCPGAADVREQYRRDPATDLYVILRDMIGWEGKEGRDRTKTIYLALAYGMGGAKLSRRLGLPTSWWEPKPGTFVEVAGPEAKRILDDFFQGAPFLRELPRRAQERAREQGFVRTVLGRRCRFVPNRRGPGYQDTHKAANRIVQGSSADQVKAAMVIAHDAGIPMQVQVHDELDLSTPLGAAGRKMASDLAEIMLTAVPCTVPHRVVPSFAPTWGDIPK